MEDANYYEYVNVMNEVKQIIHVTNPTCDTSRTSPHTRELLQCVVDCCLTMCIDMNESKIPYTYIGPNGNTSRIDHFLISDITSESVIDCSIIDDHLHSDHLPVILSLDFNINHSAVSKRPHVVKKAWHKANDCHINMYKSKLNEQMCDIFVPNEFMLCNKVNCTVHNHDICDLYHRVIDACLKAGECIPSTVPPKQNNIPG